MANDFFQFRQFTIHQQRCAMKVGTDGMLLGAWAQAPLGNSRILDIGTGTGLIALMMAQRYPDASVLGIDIDADAVAQAMQNTMDSPFSKSVAIRQSDVTKMEDADGFDAIVCNPPFFVNALRCPDEQRTTARHAVTLTYGALMNAAHRLLKTDGFFSLVIPVESRSLLEVEAAQVGFFLGRLCMVRTTPRKPVKRLLVEFLKHPVTQVDIKEGILEESPHVRSSWYHSLTQNFYLR